MGSHRLLFAPTILISVLPRRSVSVTASILGFDLQICWLHDSRRSNCEGGDCLENILSRDIRSEAKKPDGRRLHLCEDLFQLRLVLSGKEVNQIDISAVRVKLPKEADQTFGIIFQQ